MTFCPRLARQHRVRSAAAFAIVAACLVVHPVAAYAGETASLAGTDPASLEQVFAAKPKTMEAGGPVLFHIEGDTAFEFLPVRFEPVKNAGGAEVFFQCGFVIRSPSGPDQHLVTVGTGATEVTSCDGLRSIGAVRVADGGTRIAAIYGFATPNSGGDDALLLRADAASGQWSIDADGAASLSGGPFTSIWAIRKALEAR